MRGVARLAWRAGAEVAGEGSGSGGEGEIERRAHGDGGEQDSGSELGDGKHVECLFGGGAGGCGDGGVHLGEDGGKLGVEIGDGVEDVSFEQEVDSVKRTGGDEDGDAGEQAEACSKGDGDAGETEASAIDSEHNDGRGDKPEEGEQADRGKRERDQGERGGDGSGKACELNGSGPDDGIAGCGGSGDGSCGSVESLLLRADLLVDLLAKFFGELDLGSSAVPAKKEGSFIFAMKDRVAAGADAAGHHFKGRRAVAA